MDNYITVLIIIGVISAIALILLSIVFLFFVLSNNHKKRSDIEMSPITINGCLETIFSSTEGQVIAASFLSLVSLSYVLIHILINEGEKYSDKVQKTDYCDSLSSDLIERINSVEGKYE